MFNVGDIDEDGIDEIGEYLSSCSSRYKTLVVLSLKNGKWKAVGECTYDLRFTKYQPRKFKEFVKKTGKGTFEMFEKTDLTEVEKYHGKGRWLEFKI